MIKLGMTHGMGMPGLNIWDSLLFEISAYNPVFVGNF